METDTRGKHGSYANGSYRTYEEWKQNELAGMLGQFGVLTVPMRNGNLAKIKSVYPKPPQFLPYL